jgi:hypothetical protein
MGFCSLPFFEFIGFVVTVTLAVETKGLPLDQTLIQSKDKLLVNQN